MIGAWVAGSQPPRGAGLGVRAEPSEHLLLGQCSTPRASSKPQPHFVVKGTKDQGVQGTSQGHRTGEWQSWDWSSELSASKAPLGPLCLLACPREGQLGSCVGQSVLEG